MKKVYVPKLFFPLITCSTELVNTTLALVSMTILGTLLGLKLTCSLFLLPLALLVTFLFTFGYCSEPLNYHCLFQRPFSPDKSDFAKFLLLYSNCLEGRCTAEGIHPLL